MAETSITARRAQLTTKCVEKFENILRDAGIEFFRTGNNLSTLTFECGEIDGKPVYGSLKFTLHKSNYNLDEEIENFEMLLEERQKAEEEKKKKEESNAKLRAQREKKATERAQLEEAKRQARKEALNRT